MSIDPQRARAKLIVQQLSGQEDPPANLIRAFIPLVEADERFIEDAPPRWRKPAARAAQPEPKLKPKLKPVPEPELTLF